MVIAWSVWGRIGTEIPGCAIDYRRDCKNRLLTTSYVRKPASVIRCNVNLWARLQDNEDLS
jgi:hypothetical protein